MSQIIVIGSGVSGLSCARNLQLAGYDVRILSREMPLSTTSVAAGAVWSGSDATGRMRSWASVTLEHFLKLTDVSDSGVTIQRTREVYAQPVPDPWYRDRLSFFQRIPSGDLRPGLQDGYLMDVPMVAPPLYLQNLYDQFVAAGGSISMRAVETLDELTDAARLLVNCSGVGAKELASDEAVYPIRGQTLLLETSDIAVGYMDNDAVDHIFPRGDGVLVGGIKVPGDWKTEIDDRVTADIIDRCSQIEPTVADARIVRQFTGLRPGRHQVRLELERLTKDCGVIHNYGHAGVGYTLSWGCAEEVLSLAQSALN